MIFSSVAPSRAIYSNTSLGPQRVWYPGHQDTVVIPGGCPPQRVEILAVCQLAWWVRSMDHRLGMKRSKAGSKWHGQMRTVVRYYKGGGAVEKTGVQHQARQALQKHSVLKAGRSGTAPHPSESLIASPPRQSGQPGQPGPSASGASHAGQDHANRCTIR